MKNTIKVIVAVVFGFGSLVFVLNKPAAQQPVRTAGQQFKNIQVLKDMPADQLGKVMNLFAASLSVDCSFCHNTKDYSLDEKKEKTTARKMIQMTLDINKTNFNGRTEVTCNTCHNGREHPVGAPTLWPAAEAAEIKQPEPKPTADQILANYRAALGKPDKLAKVTSRHLTATRVEPSGKTEPEEIWQSGQKLRVSTTYSNNGKDVTIVNGFDGTEAWVWSSGDPIRPNPDDLTLIKRSAQVLFNPDLSNVYTKVDYRFVDQIDGRQVYLLTGTVAPNQTERLYFDVATGLLVRRAYTVRTFLGAFVYQWDFSYYRDFDGVKIPTTIKFAQPGVRFTRKITKVKINAPITDSTIFSEPKK